MNRRQTAIALGAGLLCAFAAGALAVRRKLRAGKPTPAAPQQDDPLADLLSSHNQPDQGPNANPVDAAGASSVPERVLDPLKIACAEDFQDWDDLGCRG